MPNARKKQQQYDTQYKDIPLDYRERLLWMCDKYKIDQSDACMIMNTRDTRMNSLYYTSIFIVLYQEPQGAMRPRYRFVNRGNIISAAKLDSSYIHVYSPNAAYNHDYMKRLITDNELDSIDHLICTPCDVEYRCYFKTPNSYNKIETFMAEIGLVRPLVKPDFDNIAKVYSDMYNSNVWLDDALTISGTVDKMYSILPRVEITLNYLNAVFNKQQYNNIIKRKDYDEGMNLTYVK